MTNSHSAALPSRVPATRTGWLASSGFTSATQHVVDAGERDAVRLRIRSPPFIPSIAANPLSSRIASPPRPATSSAFQLSGCDGDAGQELGVETIDRPPVARGGAAQAASRRRRRDARSGAAAGAGAPAGAPQRDVAHVAMIARCGRRRDDTLRERHVLRDLLPRPHEHRSALGKPKQRVALRRRARRTRRAAAYRRASVPPRLDGRRRCAPGRPNSGTETMAGVQRSGVSVGGTGAARARICASPSSARTSASSAAGRRCREPRGDAPRPRRRCRSHGDRSRGILRSAMSVRDRAARTSADASPIMRHGAFAQSRGRLSRFARRAAHVESPPFALAAVSVRAAAAAVRRRDAESGAAADQSCRSASRKHPTPTTRSRRAGGGRRRASRIIPRRSVRPRCARRSPAGSSRRHGLRAARSRPRRCCRCSAAARRCSRSRRRWSTRAASAPRS